ncbi:MAG: hypothetical protein IKD87_04470 [Oscillospiraceae bacterium]|nr:hypothetical protein [Oscillospiraceae bacterium]
MRRNRCFIAAVFLSLALMLAFPFLVRAEEKDEFRFEYTLSAPRPDQQNYTYMYMGFEGLRMTDFPLDTGKTYIICRSEIQKGRQVTLHFDSDGNPFIHLRMLYFDDSVAVAVPEDPHDIDGNYLSGLAIGKEEHYFDTYDADGSIISGGEKSGSYTFSIPDNATHYYLFWHTFNMYPGEFMIFGRIVDAEGPVNQNETSHADINPGEDEGVDVDPGIIEPSRPEKSGALTAAGISAAGAIAAAGALGSSSGNKGSGEEKKKRYRMYVYKGFGDAIAKGTAPVKIYARISQIIDGKEYDCPEQTERIRIAGTNLTVKPSGMEGAYMSAELIADPATEAEEGTVTFTLAGPGGSIKRNVIFRLVGEPSIAFPRGPVDGRWDTTVSEDKVQMVAGEGGKERLRFVIFDAMEEPKVIQFHDTDGFIIDYEKDPKMGFTYYALIDNRTDRAEKAADIFADKEDRQIVIEAVFENGMRVNNSFTVELYPDGLSVIPNRDIISGDRLIVDTKEDPNAKEGYAKIPPVIFDFTVCYVDDDGKAVIKKNPSCSHDDPTDNGRYGMLFSDNFEYRINHMGAAGVALFPENTLPCLPDPYEAEMTIKADVDSFHFEGVIPMAVSGERPSRPSQAEWQRAYNWLLRDIRYFGIDSNEDLKTFLQNINDHSASEIDFLRKEIIEAGVDFYREYGNAETQFADLMSKYLVVAGCLVKAGDYALEYLFRYYFAGYGHITAKFLNPMKNLLATYVGEYLASGNIDDAPDFIETVLKSSEEALSAAITGMFFGNDLKDGVNKTFSIGTKAITITAPPITDQIKEILGYIVAVYLLTCFARHYNYGTGGEKGDVYRSAVAAGSDLGYATLKAWFLDYVTRYCSSLFERIGKYCGELYRKVCQQKIAEAAEKAGWDAFAQQIRAGLSTDLRGLTRESLQAARAAREAAGTAEAKLQNEIVDNTARYLVRAGSGADKWIQGLRDDTGDLGNVVTGQIISYLMGGSGDDGSESMGTDVKELVFNYVSEWLGVQPGKVYEGPSSVNTLDISLRIEDGKIIIGILGYIAEIHILENIAALCDLMFESFFSWMNALWQAVRPYMDPSSVPDMRDQMRTSVEVINKELKAQKQRLENLEWSYTDYMRSSDRSFDSAN